MFIPSRLHSEKVCQNRLRVQAFCGSRPSEPGPVWAGLRNNTLAHHARECTRPVKPNRQPKLSERANLKPICTRVNVFGEIVPLELQAQRPYEPAGLPIRRWRSLLLVSIRISEAQYDARIKRHPNWQRGREGPKRAKFCSLESFQSMALSGQMEVLSRY